MNRLVRAQIDRLVAAYALPRWTLEEKLEYERGLQDIPPPALERAVSATIKTWLKDTHPPIGRVREVAHALAGTNGRRQTAPMQNSPPKPAPHVPVMWFAALVAKMADDGRSLEGVPASFAPFVALARETGLRPEMGAFGPARDASLVSRADQAFAAEWSRSKTPEAGPGPVAKLFLEASLHRLPSEILAAGS